MLRVLEIVTHVEKRFTNKMHPFAVAGITTMNEMMLAVSSQKLGELE
jgi:hypothetical protein